MQHESTSYGKEQQNDHKKVIVGHSYSYGKNIVLMRTVSVFLNIRLLKWK